MKANRDLVVEAALENIVEAVRRVLGNYNQSIGDSGEMIFTGVREMCPPIIKVRSICKGRYTIVSTSRCDIKDCSYWERCVKLDAERLETLRRELLKLARREVEKQVLKWPIGVEEAEEKIVEKVYEKMRG